MCHVFVGCYRPDRTRTLHGVRSGAMVSSSVRLQPPEPFNFKSPDEWPRWRRRFLQFRDASGLGDEGQQKQVSTLLYCMGESAEDILTSTDISADGRKRFEFVIAKFDSFFKVRKNVIFERARFNRRLVRRQKNLSLAFISWSTAATMASCRTRCCATVLLSAFKIKHYRKECRWTLN